VPFLVTLVAALAGAAVATLLKMPAAPLLGAMAGVVVVNVWGQGSFELPTAAKWVVYAAVGWLLGQSVTRETLGSLRTSALAIVAVVVAFLVFALALAWVLYRFTDLDLHTALLSTAPGGIAQMGVLSVEARADVPVVMAIHVLRITSVIVLMSFGLRLFGGRG
jgi:membrane AbrB-like protein